MTIKPNAQIIRSASELIDERLDTYGGRSRQGNGRNNSAYGGVHHGRRTA